MDSYSGIVVRGQQRGRALGYPTANIALTDKALSGVFAARVTLEGEAPYRAAAFADPKRGILETHLLDFNDDIYDLPITIELHKKLRESGAFESDDVLKEQIGQDVAAVREYFDHL